MNLGRLRPGLFALVSLAAVALALGTHTPLQAQSAGFVCAGPTSPAVIEGRISNTPGPGQLLKIFAFPQQNVGDIYLRNLAIAGGAPEPASTGGLSEVVGSLSQRMNDLQSLKQNLPALYATMVSIAPDASGAFSCGGFSAGKWTILAFEQNQPGSPPPLPTAHPLPSSIFPSDALGAFQRANPVPTNIRTPAPKNYYYSYAIVRRKDVPPTALPFFYHTPKPKNSPTYHPVMAAKFLPIKYFPDGYFGAGYPVPTPTPYPTLVPPVTPPFGRLH